MARRGTAVSEGGTVQELPPSGRILRFAVFLHKLHGLPTWQGAEWEEIEKERERREKWGDDHPGVTWA